MDLDETYNDCTISPQGSQVLTFDGSNLAMLYVQKLRPIFLAGYSISMGLWIQISASVTSTAYIMRLTLEYTMHQAHS